MARAIRLTRTFVRDTLGAASHLAYAGWLVPAKLHHVWAFQGKSLPAVKSMSAPLRVPTVNEKGSVEPSQEGRCTGLTAGLLSRLSDCVPTFQWGWYWLRTAGQAEMGRGSRAAQRFWTVDALSLVS